MGEIEKLAPEARSNPLSLQFRCTLEILLSLCKTLPLPHRYWSFSGGSAVKNLPVSATDAGDMNSQPIGSDTNERVHTHTHTHTQILVPRLFASRSFPCQYLFQSSLMMDSINNNNDLYLFSFIVQLQFYFLHI